MSFSDTQAVELRALVPPEFNSKCMICGSRKGLLPWQTSVDGFWGAVCDNCGKPLLIRLLRSRLPLTFSEVEIIHVLDSLGLNKRECELLVNDLFTESVVLRIERGFSFLDEGPIVEPISKTRKIGKRMYRRKTPEQIFRLCVRLSKEIRMKSEEESG